MSPSWSSVELWPLGRCTKTTNPVVRSTRVAIAEPDADPMIRSPSQWPATLRSLASSFAEHHFVADLACRVQLCSPWFPGFSAPSQVPVQVNADVTAALNIEALIDRLVRDLQLGLAGEHDREVITDLLRTPVLPQPLLHGRGQEPVIELARFGPAGSEHAAFLRGIGPVAAGCRVGVTAQLPADRRRGPPQISCDRTNAGTAQPQICDPQTLFLAQVAARQIGRAHV